MHSFFFFSFLLQVSIRQCDRIFITEEQHCAALPRINHHCTTGACANTLTNMLVYTHLARVIRIEWAQKWVLTGDIIADPLWSIALFYRFDFEWNICPLLQAVVSVGDGMSSSQ